MRIRSAILPLLALTPVLAPAARLTLEPWMVISENSQFDASSATTGDAPALVDEQTISGDPLAGTGGAPTKHWFPGWDGARYPAHAIIDLRAEYDLTDIYFRDTNGSGNVTVSTGQPFAWTTLFTDPQTGFNSWNRHTVSVRTRYLRVTLASNVSPEEIVVYGTLAPGQTPEPVPTPTPRARPAMDTLIGTNAFIDDPLGVIEHVGNVREYHPWQWDEGDGGAYPGYPANQNAWAPAWGGGGAWNFDQYYRNLRRLGLEVSPAVWQTPAWLRGTSANEEMKPIPLSTGNVSTRDALLPASYIEHADHLFQFMARYGSTAVSDSLLKLKSDQQRLSGLGSLTYIENWNEQDKGWRGREGFFTPFEFAAMSSADYDGHLGAMGSTIGIKNADPSARLVMGGIANPVLDYVRAVKLWSDFNRAGDFPFAAINLHHYCNDAGGQNGTPTTGISPEADGLRERFAAFSDYRDRYLVGRELWVSEFGWDRDSRSDQKAPAIGGETAEEIQGRWIIRAWLALAAAGVDRGHQFMLRDVAAASAPEAATRFNTSGLTGPKGDWTLHRAWYYQATLRQRLRGLHYHDDVSLGNTDLRCYRFADSSNRVRALVVWSATATGNTVSNYSIALPSGTTSAQRIDLANGSISGTASSLTITADTVTVNISEKPAIILLEGKSRHARLADRRMKLTTDQIVNEAATGNPALLVDEQTAVNNPDFGAGGSPTTVWSPGFSSSSYPASAYLDFGLRRRVTKIYLHDYNSAGAFDLATGSPGNWQIFARDNLARFAAWSAHVPTGRTRYSRFTMGSSSANVAEVAVYAQTYSGYGDWAERNFPEIDPVASGDSAPAADPDGDGVSNQLEYAFGGDPRVREQDLVPVSTIQGGVIALTYAQDFWLSDITYVVEWSTDLVTWQTTGITQIAELATSDFARVRASLPLTSGVRAFLRVRATLSGTP